MSLEIEGKLYKKFDEQQIKKKKKKREFVIETDEKYPQFIKFELIQERCDLIDDYQEGDQMKVEFNLRGREWKEKFFVNLHAWRLSKVGTSADAPQPDGDFPPPAEDPVSDDEEAYNDDLPF